MMAPQLKMMMLCLLLAASLDIAYGQACNSNPCLNGGTCNDYVTSYTCTCATSYLGPNCQLDTDQCGHLTPCRNGATCTNVRYSYICICVSGTTGTNCTIELTGACAATGKPVSLTTGSGTITSPFYDGISPYGNGLNCQWLITSGIPNGLVQLFVTSNLHPSDSLTMYNGVDASAPRIQRTSLQSNVGIFTAQGSNMFVEFITDWRYAFSGFTANYTSIPPLQSTCCFWSHCNNYTQNFTGTTGVITSPYYPNNYLNVVNCFWLIISAYPNGILRLDLTDWYFGNSVYLYIYDAGQYYNQYLISTIQPGSGPNNTTQSTYLTTQKYMTVFLNIGSSWPVRGFTATYTSIPPECVAATRPLSASAGTTGVVTSPNYPTNYFTTGDCQWLIAAANSIKVVVLTITTFKTDVNDYLYVYDGPSSSSTQLRALSGSISTPLTISSSQQYMFLRFTSDASVVDQGFRATYSQA
jgi:cubilin